MSTPLSLPSHLGAPNRHFYSNDEDSSRICQPKIPPEWSKTSLIPAFCLSTWRFLHILCLKISLGSFLSRSLHDAATMKAAKFFRHPISLESKMKKHEKRGKTLRDCRMNLRSRTLAQAIFLSSLLQRIFFLRLSFESVKLAVMLVTEDFSLRRSKESKPTRKRSASGAKATRAACWRSRIGDLTELDMLVPRCMMRTKVNNSAKWWSKVLKLMPCRFSWTTTVSRSQTVGHVCQRPPPMFSSESTRLGELCGWLTRATRVVIKVTSQARKRQLMPRKRPCWKRNWRNLAGRRSKRLHRQDKEGLIDMFQCQKQVLQVEAMFSDSVTSTEAKSKQPQFWARLCLQQTKLVELLVIES